MEAGKLVVRMGVDVAALKAGLGEAKGALSRFNSEMESLGSTLSTSLSLPLAAAGGFALKLSGDLEKAALSFQVLTKDAGAALALQKELVKFSAETPFEFADVQTGAKQLLAYGFAVGDVTKYLKTAGDLAAGMDVNITEVTSSLGRLKSGNFGEAFERLRELGIDRTALEGAGLKFDKGGSYVGSVKDAMTAVETVINSKFGGMTEKLSTSFPGMLATAWDNVQLTLSEIGTSIINAFDLKGALGSFSSGLDTIKNGFLSLSPTTQKFILGILGAAVALPPLLAAFGFLTSTIIPAVVTGFTAIISTTGLIVAAIVGAAALIIYHWDSIKAAIANVQIFTHIKDVVKSMFGAIISIFGVFYNLFTGDWANMWEHMKNTAKYAWNGIVSIMQTVLLGIETAFAGLVSALFGKTAGNKVEEFFKATIKDFDRLKANVPPLTNSIKSLSDAFSGLTNKRTKFNEDPKGGGLGDATKSLVDASNARIKAGLDAIKYRDSGTKNGAISGIDVYQMAPIRDVKITPASNIFPDFSNAIDTKVLGDKLKEASDYAIEVLKQSELKAALEDLNEGMTSTLQQGAADVFVGFGEILGNFALGQGGIEQIGQLLLGSFASIVSQLGKMAIGIGVGLLKVKMSLESLQPQAAIAAGIALVALGAIFKSGAAGLGGKIGGGGGGSKRSYASGWGGAYGPTNMVFGDHAGRSVENPEYVLRHDQVKSILNRAADNAGGGKGGFVAETVIRGADLRLLLKRAETLATS